MSLAVAFWVVFLVAVILGLPGVSAKLPPWGRGLAVWLLLALLGWAVFGAPIKG